jgi:hypothetical protein
MGLDVKPPDLLCEFLDRIVNPGVADDLAYGQWENPERGNAQFGEPRRHLRCRACINDAAQTDSAMRGRVHQAVFARGIDCRLGTILGGQVIGSPSGDGEIRMPGVIAASDAVVILEQDVTLLRHKNRSEWLIHAGKRLSRQFHAALQMLAIGIGDHGISL